MGIGLNGGAVALDSQRREPLVIAVTRFMKSRSDDIGSANATAPPLIPTIFGPRTRILRRMIRLILHSPKCSRLGDSRFALSAWKAERLWESV